MKDAATFVQELGEENEAYFRDLPTWSTSYWAKQLNRRGTIQALAVRYWNEYVGAEVIARFMARVDDPELKVLVGRQVGDESKHAYYVRKRIEALGGNVGKPLPEQIAFYEALDGFLHPEEFFSAQQFTVETQSLKRNEQALKNLDSETAEIFRKHINPDEHFHVRLGHKGMRFYCSDTASQARATEAARLIRERHVAMSSANHRIMSEAGWA